jgi:hypothetical protein
LSTGEFGAAALAFDAARGKLRAVSAGGIEPHHRAAARFALAQGLQHSGFELSLMPGTEYLAWGATAKVAQLDWAYPTCDKDADLPDESSLNPAGDLPSPRSMLSTGTIDLLAILSASQALSSETSIEGCTAASSTCSQR